MRKAMRAYGLAGGAVDRGGFCVAGERRQRPLDELRARRRFERFVAVGAVVSLRR